MEKVCFQFFFCYANTLVLDKILSLLTNYKQVYCFLFISFGVIVILGLWLSTRFPVISKNRVLKKNEIKKIKLKRGTNKE